MRKTVLFILTLIQFESFSQNVVQGTVEEVSGEPIPGAFIQEVGTENGNTADQEGKFTLSTLQDTCQLVIGSIGYIIASVKSDTTITIILDGDYYNTRWLTAGASYDILNAVFGLHFSNGFDEQRLIHFEDFQDDVLLKLGGQTNFEEDYTYEVAVGWAYPPVKFMSQITLGYTSRHFESKEFYHKDLYLSATVGIRYFGNTSLLLKTGYQELQGSDHFGFNLGLEQDYQNIYFGFRSGYYFDYFHHTAYLQAGFFNEGLFSIRAAYDRIDRFSLFTAGIHYSWVRNKN